MYITYTKYNVPFFLCVACLCAKCLSCHEVLLEIVIAEHVAALPDAAAAWALHSLHRPRALKF